MLELLKKNADEGKLIIITGAGISKDAPSYIPGWWEYNKMLLKIMGECGAETINMKGNLLDLDKLDQYLPITTVSELILDRFAGQSYYSLIELLEASIPNKNHLMLAKLAQKDILCACITTNFDTLIERAFNDYGVPLCVSDHDDDFLRIVPDSNSATPLLKIHGSVVNTQYAIDTVRQKIKGLGKVKRAQMVNLFEKNHVLFLGFSGDDFLINSDYLPISACKNGITWVSYPGSKLNSTVDKLSEMENFEMVYMNLTDFYREMKWSLDAKGNALLDKYFEMPGDPNYLCKAEKRIRDFYVRLGSRWGCTGTCLELIASQNSPLADKVCDAIKQVAFSISQYVPYDVFKIPALTAAASYEIERDNLKDADLICSIEITIMSVFWNNFSTYSKSTSNIRNVILNIATVWQTSARIMMAKNDFETALERYKKCFLFAYKGHSFQNMSSGILGIEKCTVLIDPDVSLAEYKKALFETHAARKFAIEGGFVDALIFADRELICIYTNLKDYDKARQYLHEIREYANIATQNVVASTIVNEMTAFLSPFINETGESFNLQGPIMMQSEYDWKPITGYPILRFEEGRKTKSLYEMKGFKEAFSYLNSVCKPVLLELWNGGESLEYNERTASIMDCFVGLAKEVYYDLDTTQKTDLSLTLRKCSDYLLEYTLRNFDYYALVTVLSDVAFYYAQTAIEDEEYQTAEFAAKCNIALHPDDYVDEHYIMSLAALIFSALKRNNDIDLKAYAEEFLKYPREYTEKYIPGLHDYVYKIINTEVRDCS